MKYIRNELGILKITNIGKHTVSYENSQYVGTMDIERLSECKQADTIEELCDYLVVWIKGRELPWLEPIKLGVRYTNPQIEKQYGAIWTDKGLIYVAKMNNEGEWELL